MQKRFRASMRTSSAALAMQGAENGQATRRRAVEPLSGSTT
jgi:hypothetical protein